MAKIPAYIGLEVWNPGTRYYFTLVKRDAKGWHYSTSRSYGGFTGFLDAAYNHNHLRAVKSKQMIDFWGDR